MNQELPYKDRFVAFLDILGFSKMVYSNDPVDKAKIYFYQTRRIRISNEYPEQQF